MRNRSVNANITIPVDRKQFADSQDGHIVLGSCVKDYALPDIASKSLAVDASRNELGKRDVDEDCAYRTCKSGLILSSKALRARSLSGW
jgi:hypothetical protein